MALGPIDYYRINDSSSHLFTQKSGGATDLTIVGDNLYRVYLRVQKKTGGFWISDSTPANVTGTPYALFVEWFSKDHCGLPSKELFVLSQNFLDDDWYVIEGFMAPGT